MALRPPRSCPPTVPLYTPPRRCAGHLMKKSESSLSHTRIIIYDRYILISQILCVFVFGVCLHYRCGLWSLFMLFTQEIPAQCSCGSHHNDDGNQNPHSVSAGVCIGFTRCSILCSHIPQRAVIRLKAQLAFVGHDSFRFCLRFMFIGYRIYDDYFPGIGLTQRTDAERGIL